MRTCYISGPMRGQPGMGIPAFYAAEGRLVATGWKVINPARLDTTEPCGFPEGGAEWLRFHAKRDLDLIMALRPKQGDAVVVLPGWSKSIGAQAEVALAKWIEVPVCALWEAVLP